MTPRRPTPASWTTAAGPRRRRTHRERGRFDSRAADCSMAWRATSITQVDGQEPAALAQADAPARALPGQRFRGGRGVGTRAFLRSFVVAVLTPPPFLPPVYIITHYQRSLASGARAGSIWHRLGSSEGSRGLVRKGPAPGNPRSFGGASAAGPKPSRPRASLRTGCVVPGERRIWQRNSERSFETR